MRVNGTRREQFISDPRQRQTNQNRFSFCLKFALRTNASFVRRDDSLVRSVRSGLHAGWALPLAGFRRAHLPIGFQPGRSSPAAATDLYPREQFAPRQRWPASRCVDPFARAPARSRTTPPRLQG